MHKILIYRVGHLGDTLVALPALQAIRKSFPESKISLLSNHFSDHRVGPGQVIPRTGLIDELLTYSTSEKPSPGAFEMAQLLVMLRRKRFDTLVYLAPRIRQGRNVRRDLLFFRFAGIRKVLGAQGFAELPASVNARGLPAVQHETDHLLHRLSLDGIAVPTPGTAKVELNIEAQEWAAAHEWLRANIPDPVTVKLVGFGPGSKWPSKVWPEERFAEVGARLLRSREVFPIVFGGPEDAKVGSRLINSWGMGANAAGAFSVRIAAAVLSQCNLFVGNDTGTMHLAAAVGTRCVCVMSALDWPGHWSPYGKGHIVLRRSVPCEGCLLEVCDKEGMRCLKEISVIETVAACESVLESQIGPSAVAQGEGPDLGQVVRSIHQ